MLKFIFTLVILVQFGFSQTSFVQENSQWTYTLPNESGDPLAGFVVYEVQKDTVVEGKSSTIVLSTKGDKVVVYEEEKKVHYYRGDEFKLLYDFSVVEEDITYLDMRVGYFNDVPEFVDTVLNVKSVVKSVGIKNVSGEELKTVTVDIYPEGADFLDKTSWPSTITYTERIGYEENGFIPYILEPSPSPAVDNHLKLRCYSDDDVSYVSAWWQSYNEDCDHVVSGLTEETETQVKIWPNPAHDYLILESTQTVQEVSIYNLLGELVLAQKMNENKKAEIVIRNIPTGTYFLKIKSATNVFSKQVIIQ